MKLLKFFKKKNLEDRELSKNYKERHKMFFKHMDLQYPKLSTVPDKTIKGYRKLLIENSDLIIKNLLISESERNDMEFKVFSKLFKSYILISIFIKNRNEVTRHYESISEEPGFGYIQFMTEHFLNNWPDNDLNNFLHIIVVRDEKNGLFQIHTAAGDYGGSPQGKRNYMVFPTDIMNPKEKEIVFNR